MTLSRVNDPIVRYTWGEMLDVACSPAASRNDRTSRLIYPDGDKWAGCRTFEDAVNLARNGWHEVTDATMARMLPLVEAVSSQMEQENYYYDTTGMTFDVARVLENEPECWINHESVIREAPGKVLRLVYNFTSSAGVTREVIIAKGAAIAALVQLLERGGIRVQVDTVEYSGHCPNRDYRLPRVKYQMWVTAKEANQDLDIPRLMFAMANPAMQRRISWGVHEAIWPHFGGGYYGSVGEVDDQGDIYIGCSMYGDAQWTSPKLAQQWIREQLQAQGIKLIGGVA